MTGLSHRLFLRQAHDQDIFMELAARTRSILPFTKLAHPELKGHTAPPYREPLHDKAFGTQR